MRERKFSELAHNTRLAIEAKMQDETYLSAKLVHYFKNKNPKGEPYANFETEPRQVSQIKKIINALYHSEEALKYIEDYRIYEKKKWLPLLIKLYHTIIHSYEAMDLGTHLDIELTTFLSHQMQALEPLMKDLKQIMPDEMFIRSYHFPSISELVQQQDKHTLAFKAGKIGGTVIEQMRPTQQFDYSGLTMFTSQVPVLIDNSRVWISNIGNKALEIEPSLDGKDIQELQLEANKLLDSIKKIQTSSLLNLTNIPHYISIITRLINLSNAIVYQFKSLNTTSHKIIKEWLFQLKFVYFPQVLAICDSLEEALILKPGTISEPVLKSLNDYYKTVIEKLSFVNFAEDPLGCRVQQLVDDEFTEIRETGTRTRLKACHQDRLVQHEALEAFKAFYELLIDNQQIHIAELEPEIKGQLKKYYRAFQTYVVEIDPDVDSLIVHYLSQDRRQDVRTLKGQFHWRLVQAKNFLTTQTGIKDVNLKIIGLKAQIAKRLEKSINTTDFRISLNQTIRVYAKTQREHFLVEEQAESYTKHILAYCHGATKRPSILDELNITQDALPNFQSYLDVEEYQMHLEDVKRYYIEFIKYLDKGALSNINDFSLVQKQELRRLYRKFQPYFVELLGEVGQEYDRQLVDILNPSFGNNDRHHRIIIDKRLFKFKTATRFIGEIKKEEENCSTHTDLILTSSIKHYHSELNQQALVEGTEKERRNYLIKVKVGSQTVSKIRQSFDTYLTYLNEHVVEQIKPVDSGIPFPELEDEEKVHETSAQVLAIKRIKNTLYYTEEAIKSLENLNNKSFKATYAYHMLYCAKHLYGAYKMIDSLSNDPYLHQVKSELIEAIEEFKSGLAIGKDQDESIDLSVPTHQDNIDSAIDYSENLKQFLEWFYQAPHQIEQLSKKQQNRATEIQQAKIDADVMRQRIIEVMESSNHWTKALLNLPEVGSIFNVLRKKLNTLSNETYNAVFDHLNDLKEYLFIEVFEKADIFEKQLCLKPGTVSQELQVFLSQIFNGFISSMHLSSNQCFILKVDPTYISERKQRVKLLYDDVEQKIKDAALILDDLTVLKKSISTLTSILPTTKANKVQAKQNFYKSYKQLRLQLIMFDRSLVDMPNIDDFNISPTDMVKISKASDELNKLVLHKFNAFKLDIKLYQSKLNYLSILEKELLDEQKNKTKEYTIERFNTFLDKAVNNVNDISVLDIDYYNHFAGFVKKKQKSIIDRAAKKPAEIDVTIEYEINLMKQAFDREHLKAYQCLNQVMVLLLEYSHLLDKNKKHMDTPLTAQIKQKRLKQLSTIINQDALPPADRVFKLAKIVEQDEFKKDLAANIYYQTMSWDWFCSWLNKLLGLVGFYKSTEDKILESISSGSISMTYNKSRFFERAADSATLSTESKKVDVIEQEPQQVENLLVF